MRIRLRFALSALSIGCFVGGLNADAPKGPAPAGTITAPPIVAMPSAPCCDAGHDSGCGGSGGAFADVGFYWVQPVWRTNAAYTTTLGTFTEERGANFSTTTDFSYDFSFAPRFTVGYVGCDGVGVRVRGWWFDDHANETATRGDVPGAANLTIGSATGGLFLQDVGSTLTARDNVSVTVWDLEGLKDVRWSCASVVFAGGIRYSTTKQRYEAFSFDPLTTARGAVRSSEDFEGIGPTVAYDVHAPLGGGLALYQSTRLAFLYGHHEQITSTFNSNPTFGTSNFNRNSTERDGVQAQGELEIGAEWATDWSGSHLFLQGAFVGLVYTDVSFVGIGVRAGITW